MKWFTLKSSDNCCIGKSFSRLPSLYEARFVAFISSLSTRAIKKSTNNSELFVGAMIADEVPHCSGWLFALPVNQGTTHELDKLLSPNFARKSKDYNIRIGEHKILHTIVSVSRISQLESFEAMMPYPYCYKALAEGLECFYLKSDATFRVGATNMSLEKFIAINCIDEDERMQLIQWLSRRASSLLLGKKSKITEMSLYQRRYFNRQ